MRRGKAKRERQEPFWEEASLKGASRNGGVESGGGGEGGGGTDLHIQRLRRRSAEEGGE